MTKEILVVVDMQNDFISGVLGSKYNKEVVLPNVVKLIKQFKNDKSSFIFTLDTHFENDISIESENIPTHCIYGTDGWDSPNDIKSLFSEEQYKYGFYVVQKNTFGSLGKGIDSLNLVETSRVFDSENGELEFHICGLCTDICVINNALILRNAFPNNRIIVHADACGGTTPENHKSALDVMKSCLIEIV